MTTSRIRPLVATALVAGLTAVTAVILPPPAAATAFAQHQNASAPASVPVILRVEPAMPAPETDPQRLAIHGEDFLPGLTLEVTTPTGQTMTYKGGDIQSPKTTSFAVTLALPAEGEYALVVRNTDGGVSEPYTLLVARGEAEPEPEAPTISGVTPSEPVHGPTSQTLKVAGSNFERGLRAIVTDPIGQELVEVTLGEVTDTAFDMTVLLDRAGDYEIVVSNPSGTVSNVWRLTVR